MGMDRKERTALHKKQERMYVKSGVPAAIELQEGIPTLRSTSEGVVQYVNYNGSLYKSLFVPSLNELAPTIEDYTITCTANEPTAGSTNTIDNGNTVGDDNEAGQAIADLTAKVNSILAALRIKVITK